MIVLGMLSPGSSGERWMPFLWFGLGAVLLALGTVALRWSIVADQDGITVTNARRRTIPWSELEDVLLVKVDSAIDLGFHHMLLLTRAGEEVRPAAPTGWNRPGRKLPRLQRGLLAMRDRYAPDVPETGSGPLAGDAVADSEVAGTPAEPTSDVWDVESWSGPEKALLTLIAVAVPIALLFLLDDYVPPAWADWVAVPIIGVGDLVAAGLFVIIYGSARAWVRPRLGRPVSERRP